MNFRKLFFAFGALGMLLSSCSKIAEVENINESTGLPCVITATFDATRTSIDDNWNTTWNKGDEMTVYVTRTSSSGNDYGYSQFKYEGDGKFDGTVDADKCSPWNWFAVYPSFHSSSSKATTVTAEIEHPATQTMTGDTKSHIAGKNDPVFGYALGEKEDPSITMYHIASVIDFNITNGSDKAIKVTKVEFTAPEKIAGEFTADVNLKNSKGEAPEWKAADDAVNTVTLNVTDGVEIAKESTGQFYAAIHPISAEGNYTIKVTATSEGKTYVTQKTVNANLTFGAGKYWPVKFKFVPGDPEPEPKTYTKVTSITEGTYIICGSENDGTYVCLFPPVDAQSSSFDTNNKCEHLKVGNNNITEITTSNASIIGSEVEITQSGSGWLVKYKAEDKYLYYHDQKIAFTSDESAAVQTITLSSGKGPMKSKSNDNSYEFYHSGSNSGFGYTSGKDAKNLMFFKLEGKEQTISFGEAEVTLNIGDVYEVGKSYDVQSLSGNPRTTVTWTSGDEGVATVADDGKVTIVGTGKTIITATAEESDGYLKATASYTLTIIDPTQVKYYVKVTSTPQDWSGTYLIVRESSSSTNYVFAHDQDNYKTSVTINSSKIVSADLEKYEVTISLADDGNTEHYIVKTSNGKYLYRSSNDSEGFLNDSKTYNSHDYYAKIGGSNGDFTLGTKNSSSTTTHYFRYSSPAFGFNTSTMNNTIQLYKLEDNRQAQNISFVREAVELTLGDVYKVGQSYDVQSLSGEPKTTVTWTSSNEGVATVADDGKVTIGGTGETVITATATESAEYKKATASYALTIIDPTQVKYYVLVEEEPTSWDGTYLIVNAASGSAYAFDYTTAKDATASGKAITINNKKIVSSKEVDNCAVTVSNYNNDSHHKGDPEHVAYDIKVANGKFLYRYGNPTKIIQDSSYQGEPGKGRENQHTLVYDNGVKMMFAGNTDNPNKYYFYFNSSSKFEYEKEKDTHRVYFFKKQ